MIWWHDNSIISGFIWFCMLKLFFWFPCKLQYYMDNHTGGGYIDNNDGGLETRKFFLNCLCLLLGRLDIKRFESTVSEFGMNISRILVPQVPLIEVFLGKYIADIFLNKSVTRHLIMQMNVLYSLSFKINFFSLAWIRFNTQFYD